MIVSLQVQGSGRVEKYLRAVTDDDSVETVRKAVTAMLKKPSDFEIGSKSPKPSFKAQKVLRGDEGTIPGVDAVVERAFESDSDN